jgi:hypothetical protein
VNILQLKNVVQAFALQDLFAMHEDSVDRDIQTLAGYTAFHRQLHSVRIGALGRCRENDRGMAVHQEVNLAEIAGIFAK